MSNTKRIAFSLNKYVFQNIGLSGKFVPILKENWNAKILILVYIY